jgi:ribonuclease R
MASKPWNGLQGLSAHQSLLSYPWWEKRFFPRRIRYRIACKLLRILEIGVNKSYSACQLARDMGMDDLYGQCLIDGALRYLLLKGKIEQPYPGKFRLCDFCRVTGVVDLSTPLRPELISGNAKPPVYIAPNHLHGASHGDTVVALIRQSAHRSLEAEVLRIIKFAQRRMVGNLEVLAHRAYFTPLDRELFRDIEIPLSRVKSAENGDRVVVELDTHTQGNAKLTGKVVKVLGEAGTEYVESLSAMHLNGFPTGFTDAQEAAAAALQPGITETEIARRTDLRGICTFTIDPTGTKDIDDALSIRPLDNGHWEIGVHIADVSHYIKAGSVLDKNAQERTTSVYLPDRVLPLFPEAVTRLCSLAPEEDKLAFSVLLEMNSQAKVVKRRLAKTVIRSQQQFTYQEAQHILNGLPHKFAEALKTLHLLASQLRDGRQQNGAIFFEERQHLLFAFDEMGTTSCVTPGKRNEAMKLVEEFMLLANRTTAEMMTKRHQPFIYRTHSSPNLKLFDELCRVAAHYGHTVSAPSHRFMAQEINRLLKAVEGKPEERLLASMAVRSMSRGKYSTTPRRHFALAFDHYTHFTSPIRRYIDMVVHRLLTKQFIDTTEQTGLSNYDYTCTHCNFMREKAKALQDHCEQQKCAEYLARKIGQEFTGTITQVTPAMMVVQLEDTGIQGRVMLRTLIDDHYRLDRNTYVITGLRKNNFYRTGLRVRIRVANADTQRGLIDFTIVEKTGRKGFRQKK